MHTPRRVENIPLPHCTTNNTWLIVDKNTQQTTNKYTYHTIDSPFAQSWHNVKRTRVKKKKKLIHENLVVTKKGNIALVYSMNRMHEVNLLIKEKKA